MATWSPDNFVITNEGEKVLSSVIIGIDRLTITRIVTGAGYVAPSALYKQTVVTNPKQEMQVTNVATNSNGSEVTVRVTNEGINEPYPIYQIGVYVTHPDFEGEVLYMLAQCDTATPDYMPAREEVPVSFTYSLYIAHSGTDKVTITVSDAGLLSTSVFLKYKVDIEEKFNQVNTEINKRSLKGHKHVMSDVTDLKDALDKKANIDHTHNNYIDKNSKADEATEDKRGMLSDIDKSWINGKFQRYYYGEDGTTANKLGYYKIASFVNAHTYACAGLKLRIFSENFANYAHTPTEIELVFGIADQTHNNFVFIYADPNTWLSGFMPNLFVKYTAVNNTTNSGLVNSICELYWQRTATYRKIIVEVLSEYDRAADMDSEWSVNGKRSAKYRKVWTFDTTNVPIADIEEEGCNVFALNNIVVSGNPTTGNRDTPIYLNKGKPTNCSHKFTDYLPLTGGTISGNLAVQGNFILYEEDGRKRARTIMHLYDDTNASGNFGGELTITASGNTYIGGGESPFNLRSELLKGDNIKEGENYSGTTERMYVTSDNEIFFYSNCNTIADRKGLAFARDGVFYPHIIGQAINLGRPAAPFAHVYANNFHGALTGNVTGNASTADKLKTARNIKLSGVVTGNVNFDGSANVNINTFRRGCIVGQSTNTTDSLSKPWFKFAEVTAGAINSDYRITFLVESSFPVIISTAIGSSKKMGILQAHFRTSNPTTSAPMIRFTWLVANREIKVTDFCLCNKADSTSWKVELWAKIPTAYEKLEFTVLQEGNASGAATIYNLFNTITAGSQAALPTGYIQNFSTLETLINPIALPVTTTDPAGAIQGEMWVKK